MLSWLVLSFAMEAGISSGAFYQYSPASFQLSSIDKPMDITMGMSARVEWFVVKGSIRTDMFLETNGFNPWQTTYKIGAELDFRNFIFGIEHVCWHPMRPYSTFKQATWTGNGYGPSSEGSFDRAYVRLQTN